MGKSQMPRWKKLVFGALTAALVLAAMEGGVRLSPLQQRLDQPTAARKQALHLRHVYRSPALMLSDQRRPGDPPGSRAFVSADGAYRQNRVLMPKPPGVFRLVILGDSTAWGVIGGIPQGEANDPYTLTRSLGWQVQQLLAQRLRPRVVELINLALPGTISEFTLERGKEALRLSPDAIIIYTGINDTNEDLVCAMLDPDCCRESWLRRRSSLVDLAATLLTRPHSRSPAAATGSNRWLELRSERTSENLESLLQLAGTRRVPVFVGLPVVAWAELYQGLDDLLEGVALDRGGIPVHLEPLLRQAAVAGGVPFSGMYSADKVHPNPKGYLVMARAFVGAMERSGAIGRR